MRSLGQGWPTAIAGGNARPAPNKEAIAGALTRAGDVARTATDFAERAEKLAPHVAALASWLCVAGKAVAAAFGVAI